MNWPIWLFAIVLVGLLVGYARTRSALFLPITALVIYLAVDFSVVEHEYEDLWNWSKTAFVVLMGLTLVAILLQRAALLFFVGALTIAAMVVPAGAAVAHEVSNDETPSETAEDVTPTTAAPTSSTTSTTVPQEDLGLSEEEAQQVAQDLAEIYQGFLPGEVATGTGNIPDSPEERAENVSFTKETIETQQDLCTFFASDHDKAPEARAQVEQALRAAGYGDDEIHEALDANCERWIWVAPTVESQILGTTFILSNNEVVQSQNYRGVAPNDAMWHYITTDGHIVAGAAVRADCGNPNVFIVRPVRPNTPEVPPIDVPPGTPCPYNPDLDVDSPFCLKPKDPSVDPLLNPDIPDQVQGPGTTPVGGNPGPPETPVDSPTGCHGPCPTTQPPATQPPPSGGGSTPTTVPGCGQAGQPSCDNTGVSPPTTTAPPAAPPPTQPPQDGEPPSP